MRGQARQDRITEKIIDEAIFIFSRGAHTRAVTMLIEHGVDYDSIIRVICEHDRRRPPIQLRNISNEHLFYNNVDQNLTSKIEPCAGATDTRRQHGGYYYA